MRKTGIVVFEIAILVQSTLLSEGQGLPTQLPSHVRATSSDRNWHRPQPTFLSVESRKPGRPEKQEYLNGLREKALKSLRDVSFPVVTDPAKAVLEMTLLVAPDIRYGPFHYQNAPYIYLLVREHSNGRLVYCSYRRLGHFRSASSQVLSEWKSDVAADETSTTDSLADCAAQAMRPVISGVDNR
jgi:hypothetical protein